MKSDIVLRAGSVPFRYSVFVEPVELEKAECPQCEGRGEIGTGWMDDDIETCPRCHGHRTVKTLYFWDHELEEHLKKCMDEYLERKYPKNVP